MDKFVLLKIISKLEIKDIVRCKQLCKPIYREISNPKSIFYTWVNYNHLTVLLKLYPDKAWHWDGLSRNPNITFDIVLQNLDRISWFDLSENKFISPFHL